MTRRTKDSGRAPYSGPILEEDAGLGLGGTEHGVREMTEEKLIVLNLKPAAK